MLYFGRIDVSEGIDINKISDFKFQPNVCNGCHDLLMMPMNLSDIAILNIKGSDYRCIISGISKSEAVKLVQNTDLAEKSGTL